MIPPTASHHTAFSACLLALVALLLPACASSARPRAELATLQPLASTAECNKCEGVLFPGALEPHPTLRYAIHSDLPEMYWGRGVLYATTPVLPEFDTYKNVPMPLAQRTQRRDPAFTTIDGPFEVFVYHFAQPGGGKDPGRVVVYARNAGSEPVTLTPRQIMEAGNNTPSLAGPETRLARRLFEEAWDHPVGPTTLAPGEGAAIGWTQRIGEPQDGPDAARSAFVTGILRADVASESPANLEIYTVGISPEAPPQQAPITEATRKELGRGARSGETAMDLLIPPPKCHVRRVVGVYRNVRWAGHLDGVAVDRLTSPGLTLLMAAPAVQTVGCEAARQTAPLLLYPPYVHPETIGNFMMEYDLRLRLVNTDTTRAHALDLRFGKRDAPVGLIWQLAADSRTMPEEATVRLQPARAAWSNDKTAPDYRDKTRTFLADSTSPILLPPGAEHYLRMRVMVIGTSSLPYQIHLHATPVAASR